MSKRKHKKNPNDFVNGFWMFSQSLKSWLTIINIDKGWSTESHQPKREFIHYFMRLFWEGLSIETNANWI